MENLQVAILIVICIILVYFLYKWKYEHSYYNTSLISTCNNCEKYHVHNSHHDKKAAAKVLEEITRRNKILIDQLRNKYDDQHFMPGLDPNKNNRIDVVAETALKSEYIQERVSQLVRNYNPKLIYEISPMNKDGYTSYTEDKERLIFCLRKKEPNANGDHELHDINIIMFVVIHELSHMMNNSWGHGRDFWELFKFMLENAVEAEIYIPDNYALNPINYCGLNITYSPLFDKNLN
jgi:predicted metal-dependent hydrolase